ncbi:hypothetical protein A9G11_10710 [Gilliamella sp. wkB108]|uniref:hypothetical protein n=1 Tax=Gilliamella sp. wkB108 TaxID=3120256 RepID=UPI00080E8C25|nr:hypothetical protein [Gilliamella apicola]OCG28485.1 hypothetical protein A9G11_10710 [Gilliamella apicola]
MKNFLFSSLLLMLLPYFTYASDIDLHKDSYYLLIKDRLSDEDDLLKSILDEFVTQNNEKISIAGCDLNHVETTKENINAILDNSNFYKDYDQELKKYHLSLNEFNRLYSIDESNLSEECRQLSYKYIIQLENNELMIPYKNLLSFYQRLSKEDENKIDNLKNNQQCFDSKKTDEMQWTNICYYKNMTILDVYNAMALIPDYVFREKIKEGKNFSHFYKDKEVKVDYIWDGTNKLEIIQYFAGGDTAYYFIYQGGKTKVISIYSAD